MEQFQLIIRSFDEYLSKKVDKIALNEIYKYCEQIPPMKTTITNLNSEVKDSVKVNKDDIK